MISLKPAPTLLALCLVAAAPTSAAAETKVGACPVFPADNIWNTPVAGLPLDPNSDAYVNTIGAAKPMHADFAAALDNGAPIGIPYVVVPADQPKVDIVFADYADESPAVDESDAGPAPIPPDAPVEGGLNGDGDCHVIVVQQQSCTLFELYKAVPNAAGSWNAVGSVRFDLESNDLRPDGWTSADIRGLGPL